MYIYDKSKTPTTKKTPTPTTYKMPEDCTAATGPWSLKACNKWYDLLKGDVDRIDTCIKDVNKLDPTSLDKRFKNFNKDDYMTGLIERKMHNKYDYGIYKTDLLVNGKISTENMCDLSHHNPYNDTYPHNYNYRRNYICKTYRHAVISVRAPNANTDLAKCLQNKETAEKAEKAKEAERPKLEFVNQRKTWDDAKAYCENKGGTLAHPGTSHDFSAEEIHNAVENQSRSLKWGAPDHFVGYWLGGSRQGEDWKWMDGANVDMKASGDFHWRAGNPKASEAGYMRANRGSAGGQKASWENMNKESQFVCIVPK